MPDDLYDRDIVLWSENQAEFLRRLAAGERVNADLDFENVIEEIESVGRSQISAVQSHLKRAMEHLVKIAAFPRGPARHWRVEVVSLLDDARRAFAPSMRRRIDLDDLYRSARDRIVSIEDHGYGPLVDVTDVNPSTLDDFLPPGGARVDVDRLIAPLRPA